MHSWTHSSDVNTVYKYECKYVSTVNKSVIRNIQGYVTGLTMRQHWKVKK